MIIYGVRNKQLAGEVIADKCENCGNNNCIDMHVFQRYAHIFWIPLLPLGKTGVSQCDNCKQVLKSSKMTANLKIAYQNVAAQTKTPIWTFTGIAIIAVFIVFGINSDNKKQEKIKQYIAVPQKGDVLSIKTKEHNYTIYRIDAVKNDSIFIQPSNYEANKISGLKELKNKGEAGYSEDVFGMSKTELQQLLTKEEIYDIERK
jgi:hypothetical protein